MFYSLKFEIMETSKKKPEKSFSLIAAILKDQLEFIFGRDNSLVDSEARNLILSNPKNKRKLIDALDNRRKELNNENSKSFLNIQVTEGELIID
jgi:hypothetical protein